MNTKPLIIVLLVAGTGGNAWSQDGAGQETATGERLEPVIVRGFRDESPGIARNSLTPRELSRSVQIISDELIETIRPAAIEDLVTLASNVAFLGDNDGRENSFVIRGFQGTPVLRDGFRIEGFGGNIDPEPFNLERIEVLKGPDSILYGESSPGGLVNLVVKRPLDTDHGSLALEVGSFGSFSPRLDFGGGSDTVRYRVLAMAERDEGWRDYDNDNERFFFAPSVRFDIGERGSLTLIAEITEDDSQADFGTAIDLNGNLTAPPEQVNNHPQDTIERHQHIAGADFDWAFDDAWSLGARARYFDTGYEYSALLLPFDLDQQTLVYFRVPAQQEQDNEEYAFQMNLSGDFSLGGMRNRLYTGVDYRDSATGGQTRFDPTTPYFLDWTDPDYSERPPPLESIPVAPGFYAIDDIERVGLYLQNHLSLTENTIVSLGVRYDQVDRDPRPGSSSTPQDDSETSFQGGISHALSDALSVFAGYSESFTPNYALDRFGEVLEPETGEGWEVGLKGALFDDRLGFSTAYFDITQQNVATADPNAGPSDPNPFGSIATGEQRSRGFEIDFSGQVGYGVEVFGSYGYTDSEITRSNNGDQGLPVVGTPEHTASLWASYRLTGNVLTGLDLSLGFQYVGERLALGDPNFDGDTGDAVYVDDYTLLNAALGYRYGKWDFALNFNNLTDEEYVEAAWGGLSRSVHAGAPLEVVGAVTYSF